MRILVLGGTAFLSRLVAERAAARGHEVVAAARGVSGAAPDGVRLVRWDRDEPVPDELVALAPDVVVEVARRPSYVRRAVAALGDAHWLLVSTCSVYADDSTPGHDAGAAVVEAIADDVDPASSPQAYGGMKVACEQLVRDGATSALVLRPGLVVGPGDPSGRFAYWPAHAAQALTDGRPLLVPGAPDDPVQVIDVRDLAEWLVAAAESGLTGTYDALAPSMSRRAFLAGLAVGVGGTPDARWVPSAELLELGVREWSGEGAIPVWVGEEGYAGFMARDVSASLAAGLRVRQLEETVRDTLAWLRETPDAPVGGLTRAEELDVLERSGHLADTPSALS